MRIKGIAFIIFVFFALPGIFNDACLGGMVQSTQEQQKEVYLTIYNSGIGLVKDRRDIPLGTGIREILFADVAPKIIPSSVRVNSLTRPDSLQVLEQRYQYDLISPEKLLDKFVGKEVKLVSKKPYTDTEEVVTALLLSNHNGPVFKIGDEITFNYPGRIIFPKLPENVASKPSLFWRVKSSAPEQRIEAAYITEGIDWKADYTLDLNEAGNQADLSGWVTINNQSGIAFNNARVKLVAGDISRVRDHGPGKIMPMMAAAAPETPVKGESFSEYHLYTLEAPIQINDNEIKQIAFLNARHILLNKELVLKGESAYFTNKYDKPLPQKVGIYFDMVNTEKNGPGIPLPGGVVRVFKNDKEGNSQLIGENTIVHTPKDEKLRIKTGEAFDISADRKQMEWNKISRFTYETVFEITLRNHGAADISVKVVEPIPGDWIILTSSHPPQKIDANTVEFIVPVPKDGETRLTYKTQVTY
ncbi:MAG: DUF4139 domain-containing protein [Nitrospirae bacterium]|nr:DUF4139 domain-containing protein [Nitrospirota bacterium]